MKKIISILLSILMIFSTTTLTTMAMGIDTEIDMGGLWEPPIEPDEPEIPAVVTIEAGTDAGYIEQSGNNYTLLLMREMNFQVGLKRVKAPPTPPIQPKN